MFNRNNFICFIFLFMYFEPVLNVSSSNDGDTLLENETINVTNESYLENNFNYEDESNPFTFLMFQQYFLLGWTALIVIVIGIAGNIFTIIVLQHPTMKSPINIHFTGLAISDLTCLCLILLSIPLRYILVKHEQLWYHEFHSVIFPIVYPITIAFQLISIFLTVAVSICRCITIYFTELSSKIYTIKKSLLIMLLIYFLGLLLSTPYWFRYKTSTSQNFIRNTTEIHLVESHLAESINRIHLILITMSYAIPLLILLIVNTLLISVLLKSRRLKLSFGLNHRNEIRTTIILIVMIISFFVCNMPNFVFNMMIMLKKNQREIYIMNLHQWSNFLLILNYSSNFAIYCLFGESFRNAAKLIFNSNLDENNNNRQVDEKCRLNQH